jgi:hypothetical protein
MVIPDLVRVLPDAFVGIKRQGRLETQEQPGE